MKRLTGLSINHVINVDFQGFKQAVDAIGCVYVDIDRRYFNDSPGYAYINVQPGYQKLCGEKALEYARFRHEDSDLVRSARQQDLLRETKQQIGVGKLVDDRDKLIRIFGQQHHLRRRAEDARRDHPAAQAGRVQRGPADARGALRGCGDHRGRRGRRATELRGGLRRHGEEAHQALPRGGGDAAARAASCCPRAGASASPGGGDPDGGLEKAPAEGADQALQAIQAGAGKELPVYYPTVRVKNSIFAGPPRYYKIKTTEVRRRKSYRMVVKRGLVGEYYGIQGTTWRNPPILESESEKRRIGKRTFELHYDGDRLRIVAWRTPKAVYWVSNTLLRTLSERQMLAIARSTRLP